MLSIIKSPFNVNSLLKISRQDANVENKTQHNKQKALLHQKVEGYVKRIKYYKTKIW